MANKNKKKYPRKHPTKKTIRANKTTLKKKPKKQFALRGFRKGAVPRVLQEAEPNPTQGMSMRDVLSAAVKRYEPGEDSSVGDRRNNYLAQNIAKLRDARDAIFREDVIFLNKVAREIETEGLLDVSVEEQALKEQELIEKIEKVKTVQAKQQSNIQNRSLTSDIDNILSLLQDALSQIQNPFKNITPAAKNSPENQNLDLQNPDLQNVDLQNLDVQNLDVQKADIETADLQNVDLQNLDLQNLDLQNLDLQNPGLQNGNPQKMATPKNENPQNAAPEIENVQNTFENNLGGLLNLPSLPGNQLSGLLPQLSLSQTESADPTGDELPEQDLPDPNLSEQDLPEQALPQQALPQQDLPRQNLPQDLPVQNLPGQNLAQDLPGQYLPGQNLPGKNLPGQNLPGQYLPGQNLPEKNVTRPIEGTHVEMIGGPNGAPVYNIPLITTPEDPPLFGGEIDESDDMLLFEDWSLLQKIQTENKEEWAARRSEFGKGSSKKFRKKAKNLKKGQKLDVYQKDFEKNSKPFEKTKKNKLKKISYKKNYDLPTIEEEFYQTHIRKLQAEDPSTQNNDNSTEEVDTQKSTENTENSADNDEHSTDNTERSTENTESLTGNDEKSIVNTDNNENSTANTETATEYTESSTGKSEKSTEKTEYSAGKSERSTENDEYSTQKTEDSAEKSLTENDETSIENLTKNDENSAENDADSTESTVASTGDSGNTAKNSDESIREETDENSKTVIESSEISDSEISAAEISAAEISAAEISDAEISDPDKSDAEDKSESSSESSEGSSASLRPREVSISQVLSENASGEDLAGEKSRFFLSENEMSAKIAYLSPEQLSRISDELGRSTIQSKISLINRAQNVAEIENLPEGAFSNPLNSPHRQFFLGDLSPNLDNLLRSFELLQEEQIPKQIPPRNFDNIANQFDNIANLENFKRFDENLPTLEDVGNLKQFGNIGKVPNLQDLESLKRFESIENLPTLQDVGNLKQFENIENLLNLQDLENLKRYENIENLPTLQDVGNLKQFENIENLPNLQDLENMKRFENIENLPTLQDVGNLKQFENIENLPNLQDLEYLERFENIENLPTLHDVGNLKQFGNIENLPNLQDLKNLKRFENIENLPTLEDVGNLEEFEIIENLANLQDLENIESLAEGEKVVLPLLNKESIANLPVIQGLAVEVTPKAGGSIESVSGELENLEDLLKLSSLGEIFFRQKLVLSTLPEGTFSAAENLSLPPVDIVNMPEYVHTLSEASAENLQSVDFEPEDLGEEPTVLDKSLGVSGNSLSSEGLFETGVLGESLESSQSLVGIPIRSVVPLESLNALIANSVSSPAERLKLEYIGSITSYLDKLPEDNIGDLLNKAEALSEEPNGTTLQGYENDAISGQTVLLKAEIKKNLKKSLKKELLSLKTDMLSPDTGFPTPATTAFSPFVAGIDVEELNKLNVKTEGLSVIQMINFDDLAKSPQNFAAQLPQTFPRKLPKTYPPISPQPANNFPTNSASQNYTNFVSQKYTNIPSQKNYPTFPSQNYPSQTNFPSYQTNQLPLQNSLDFQRTLDRQNKNILLTKNADGLQKAVWQTNLPDNLPSNLPSNLPDNLPNEIPSNLENKTPSNLPEDVKFAEETGGKTLKFDLEKYKGGERFEEKFQSIDALYNFVTYMKKLEDIEKLIADLTEDQESESSEATTSEATSTQERVTIVEERSIPESISLSQPTPRLQPRPRPGSISLPEEPSLPEKLSLPEQRSIDLPEEISISEEQSILEESRRSQGYVPAVSPTTSEKIARGANVAQVEKIDESINSEISRSISQFGAEEEQRLIQLISASYPKIYNNGLAYGLYAENVRYSSLLGDTETKEEMKKALTHLASLIEATDSTVEFREVKTTFIAPRTVRVTWHATVCTPVASYGGAPLCAIVKGQTLLLFDSSSRITTHSEQWQTPSLVFTQAEVNV